MSDRAQALTDIFHVQKPIIGMVHTFATSRLASF